MLLPIDHQEDKNLKLDKEVKTLTRSCWTCIGVPCIITKKKKNLPLYRIQSEIILHVSVQQALCIFWWQVYGCEYWKAECVLWMPLDFHFKYMYVYLQWRGRSKNDQEWNMQLEEHVTKLLKLIIYFCPTAIMLENIVYVLLMGVALRLFWSFKKNCHPG
jgi:hypothetical protein